MSRKDDLFDPTDDRLTLQDCAKIILGGFIVLGGFWALTVILFTL